MPLCCEIRYDRDNQPVLLKKERIVSGDSITNATSGVDQQSGTPAVFVTLDGHGADRMERFTKDNVGKPMAVLFIEDRPTGKKDAEGKSIKRHVEEVISVATIQGVFGRHFQTTGLDSQQEARDLALFLRAGALKAPIDIVEERTIGPSLGQESIEQVLSIFATNAARKS